MPRPRDNLRIEVVGGAQLNAPWTSVQVINNISAPSELSLELGNTGTFSAIEDQIRHGTKYRGYLNDKLRITGRVEMRDIPIDAGSASVTRFIVRTKLADAMYASARARKGASLQHITLQDFVLTMYEPLGYTLADFEFQQGAARDLLTGQDTKNKGTAVQADLTPIALDEARITAQESIYEAVDRHLRRHGLLHWDSPDGKIVIGAINDDQPPIYKLRYNRNNPQLNNVIGMTRTEDWSGIPSHVELLGVGARRGGSRSRVGYVRVDSDLISAGFYRPIQLEAEGIRTYALAERAARREMSARSKAKDSFDIELDQWSWWNGSKNIPWGIDCVVDIESDVAGGALGAYYVHSVQCNRTPQKGDVVHLRVVKKGIWVI